MERRARDRVSRKGMYLEEKRDTMKLRRVDDRANGLANNFVSVSLVLFFVILPSRSSFFSFSLSQSETISFSSSSANCLVSFRLDFLDCAR